MDYYILHHLQQLNTEEKLYRTLINAEKNMQSENLISNNNSVDFIGIIIDKDTLIYSFPKHYPIDKNNMIEDFQLLFKVIIANNNSVGLDIQSKNQFPIADYLKIHNYYLNNGLYIEYDKYDSLQPNGKVNWLKMIRNSNKIIDNNNLILHPTIYQKETTSLVYLTECMDYILFESYKKYFKYINNSFKYERQFFNNSFENTDFVISKLYKLLSITFKDSTKKLIISCINYFKWQGSYGTSFQLFITDFNFYWQKMIHYYLNENSITPEYVFSKSNPNIVNDIKFYRNDENFCFYESEKNFFIDSIDTSLFPIFIDHFCCNQNNLYLLDSKYYIDTDSLNYKQCAYYYFIHNIPQYKNKITYNILIYPTSKTFHSKIILNRSHIPNDSLVLSAVFFNIKEIMKFYVS